MILPDDNHDFTISFLEFILFFLYFWTYFSPSCFLFSIFHFCLDIYLFIIFLVCFLLFSSLLRDLLLRLLFHESLLISFFVCLFLLIDRNTMVEMGLKKLCSVKHFVRNPPPLYHSLSLSLTLALFLCLSSHSLTHSLYFSLFELYLNCPWYKIINWY